MVLFALQPSTVWEIRWSAAGFPTLASIEMLRQDPLFTNLGTDLMEQLLADDSEQTAVERGDGFMPAVRIKRSAGRLGSVQQLAAVFDECVGPARLEASTRRGYQASWRAVLTWGIAHECVASLLPRSKTVIKALSQELLTVGCSPGTIRNIWSSIEDRHRRFGQSLPLGGVWGLLAHVQGSGCSARGTFAFHFPMGVHHLKWMLELIGLAPAQSHGFP